VSAAPTGGAGPELDDVQGLVRYAYKHHVEASFLLLRVRNPAAARDWLARAPVASAVPRDPPPATVLQVALTGAGLRALGVPRAIVEGFAAEFVDGISADATRARRLGDVGPNDPSRWRWGAGERIPDALVMLYATPGELDAWQRTVEAQLAEGFDRLDTLATADMGGREPFGFVDGISQPLPDWERQRQSAARARGEDQLAYTNRSRLGEFLLGYPNEYGLYTSRPLLPPQGLAGTLLPRAEDAPDMADLGRNGTYLVMRQLSQDVRAFWRTLDQLAGGVAATREQLAASLVGRTLQGAPLLARGADPLTADPNDFDFDSDRAGLHCPLGAHVRRANPRNADLPPGSADFFKRFVRTLGFDAAALEQDRIASTRFHRLLRRGREYGVQIAPARAASAATPPAPDAESGLHFVCLAANITRQFEFVQSAWMMSPKFAGLRDQADPLLGHRLPAADGTRTDCYAIPRSDAPDRRLCELPRFVTVVGGGYFLLPGIRALRFLATVA